PFEAVISNSVLATQSRMSRKMSLELPLNSNSDRDNPPVSAPRHSRSISRGRSRLRCRGYPRWPASSSHRSAGGDAAHRSWQSYGPLVLGRVADVCLVESVPRLRVRYDKRADIHEAFLSLGCALIWWHALRKTWATG